jgi:uncharacterized protein YifE (UPF0438 family)
MKRNIGQEILDGIAAIKGGGGVRHTVELPDNANLGLASEVEEENSCDAEFGQSFEGAVRKIEIKREIAEWESLQPQSITEKSIKDEKLKALNAELLASKDLPISGTQDSKTPATKKPIPDKDRITSTIPFNQAIEKMYRHYYDKGEYDFIRADYVDAFIQKMGELRNKENIPHPEDEKELINYLAERIKTVKKVSGAWKITIQEIELPAKRGFKNTAELKTYDIVKVTKKLCRLREKYPIPCTIPIP